MSAPLAMADALSAPGPTRFPSRPVLRRLFWYHHQLASGRPFTAVQAAGELEVSERTVRRDLCYASTLGWDVTYDAGRRTWTSPDGQLPLPAIDLTEGEAVALLVADQALRAYAGTPFAPLLRTAFDKIVAALGSPVTLDADQVPLPTFTGPPIRPVETEQYQQLFHARQQCRVVALRYRSPGKAEAISRHVEPHHLFSFAGDWYLAAYCRLREDFRTFALGNRMVEVTVLDERFTPRPDFHPGGYLAEGFGLFRGGEPQQVVLRFARGAAPYVREKQWTQHEERNELPDGEIELRMTVALSVGLERWVLEWGSAVEVVAPPEFRRAVADELDRALNRYRSG